MNLKLPEFAEGIHYEELRGIDPFSCVVRGNKVLAKWVV